MINIIRKMFIDLIKFMVIFGIVFLIFVAFGSLLFANRSEFQDLISSFFTLYNYALGQFDFVEETEFFSTQDYYFFTIYMMAWVMVSAILLLNLLIALMTDTYASLQ